jgi:hypothetical protein
MTTRSLIERVERLAGVDASLIEEITKGAQARAFADARPRAGGIPSDDAASRSARSSGTAFAPHRRRYRLGALVAVAAVLALLLVSQALGVAPGIGSIFGESAPKPVKKTFAIVHFGGQVETRTIRLVAQTRAQGHLLRLWTARQTGGTGVCTLVQVDDHTNNGVGCGGQTTRYGVAGWSVPSKASDSFYYGFAPQEATEVRLRFADSTSVVVPVTKGAWVTALPPSRRTYGHDLRSVSEVAKNGRVLARQPFGFVQRPIVPVTPRVTVARFAGRPLTVARANTGGVCVAFAREGGPAIDSCPGLSRQGFGATAPNPSLFDGPEAAWMVRVDDRTSLGRLVLFGPLRERATTARIIYSDASSLRVHVSRGAFYVELPMQSGATPARLEYLRGSKVVKATRLVGPKTALYTPGWRGARYKLVLFGDYNSLNYVVGPLEWPAGHRPRPAKSG